MWLFVLLQLLGLALVAHGYGCMAGLQPSADGNWCYMFYEEPMNFNDAKSSCADFLWDGSSYIAPLIKLRSASENQVIAGIADGIFWIGAHFNSSTNSWQWQDGSALDYSNWMAGHPSQGGNNMCVAVDSVTGLWTAMQCDQKLNYVCENRASHAPTTTVAPGCKPGLACYNGFGYIIPTVQVFSWQKGDNYCADKYNGGHLVSIHDRNEQLIVNQLLSAKAEAFSAFIGAFAKGGEWHWSDGTKFDFDIGSEAKANDGQCLMADNGGRGSVKCDHPEDDIGVPVICKFPMNEN